MKNKILSTVLIVALGFMIFAPVATAQTFYFNGNTDSFRSIVFNTEQVKTFTQFRNIFYYFTQRNNLNIQPTTPETTNPQGNSNDENTPLPTEPVVPKEEQQPTQPQEPTQQPTQPSQPQEPVEQPTQPSQNTETNNIVNSEELKMLEYINNERTKAGVAPLQMDTEVARVAQIKSQDMVDNGYFSHTSPNYGSPFDMMKSFGISYSAAGENIAINSTVLNAHTAFMNSEGHRNNILNPNFTHIGIGIVQNKSTSGITVTQMFIKK